ncbi:MAG: hypothetical protein LBI67_12320, partial [Treponema sp.]|nr:hypothetical protein [Treponema sp.]
MPAGTLPDYCTVCISFCQETALPHKKSYPKGTMPQNKNLTQINPADGGIGGLYGVFDERKTD